MSKTTQVRREWSADWIRNNSNGGFYRKRGNNNIRTHLDSPLGWHDCSTAGHDSLSSTNTVLSPEENDKIVKQITIMFVWNHFDLLNMTFRKLLAIGTIVFDVEKVTTELML